MTLKLALEPLFFFALEFLQNDRLNISSFCDIYFEITTTTTTTLDSGTSIFAKGHSSVNWKQSLEHQQQSVTQLLQQLLQLPLKVRSLFMEKAKQAKNTLVLG